MPEDEGPLSPEEQSAVTQYQDSYTRLPSGQYSVSLPRHSPVPELGEFQPAALKHFLQNERSLKRKGRWEAFDAVLHEYTALGHAERVPSCDSFKHSSEHFYLPMHGVVKNSSTATKLRVVFDASAKTTSGFSLNDQLLAGPSLYPNLSTIISKFRCQSQGIFQKCSVASCSMLKRRIITGFSSVLPLVRLKTGGCCTSYLEWHLPLI